MKLLVLILASLMSLYAHGANPPDCFLIICRVNSNESENCSVSPSNLTAKLPKGFSITAIRSFTTIMTRGEEQGQTCARVPKLPFPILLDVGGIYGSISISGTLRSTGTLRYEPSDGGDLEFWPGLSTFDGVGPFFRTQFERLKLDEALPSPSVAPPRWLRDANCWQANATVEATDFSLVVGDSSSAGTYVRRLQLSRVRDFRACQWGGP